MSRSAGWSILAQKALELSALALACQFMDDGSGTDADGAGVVEATDRPVTSPEAPVTDPLDALKQSADADTRLYRGRDSEGVMYAAFYSDGRIRVADETYNFAGMVQNGHAHVRQIDGDAWSEVFVRITPGGLMQLELRDGPYDGRVLVCEALSA